MNFLINKLFSTYYFITIIEFISITKQKTNLKKYYRVRLSAPENEAGRPLGANSRTQRSIFPVKLWREDHWVRLVAAKGLAGRPLGATSRTHRFGG